MEFASVNKSQASSTTNPDLRLRQTALATLAGIRDCEPNDIEDEFLAGGGDVEIDSLEGICVLAALEEELGVRVDLDDLDNQPLTFLSSVLKLASSGRGRSSGQ